MPIVDTKDGSVFPGVWLGRVMKLDDEPSYRRVGKVKVKIPDVYGDNTPVDKLPWAMPLFPSAIHTQNKAGFFFMPPVGANVGVMFERGDPQSPRWIGGWTQAGRIPFPFQYSQGDKFPHISAWRGADGMMIRFVEGERLEIFLGESGSFDSEGTFQPDGEHSSYDTFLSLDKVNKKVTFRCKFDIDIRCEGKLSVRAPQFRIRCVPNQQYNSETEDWENDPESPDARFELNVFDPDAEKGARIIAEPGKLTGRARHVKGFEDS